jgi:hypothetical protein
MALGCHRCYIIAVNKRDPTENNNDRKYNYSKKVEKAFDKFNNEHKKMFLGNFNIQLGREDISRPTLGNEKCMEILKRMVLN